MEVDTLNRVHLVYTRVALVHAWTVLVDTLSRLMHNGSAPARACWEALPDCAPVGSKTALKLACRAANRSPIPLDALPEWDAYLHALTEFNDTPLFGGAPVPVPDGAIAALDNGNAWWFRRG